MKKVLLAATLLVLLFTACKKDVPYLSPENSLLSFQIAVEGNTELIPNTIDFFISDTVVVGVSGNMNSKASLIATFTSSGAAVTVNGVPQESGVTVNDFTNPVTYIVTAKNGSERKYTVRLKSFTGLPIVYITAEAPILSTIDYVNGTMKIDGNQDFTEGLYDGAIQIRGRGNSTWYQEKRPYKIKLPSKAKILGMPSDKEWALLANYYDKTLMRNDVAFELSERVGLAWTPRRRFVEVIMNGQYLGNYLLTETVKVSNDRLNIPTMDPKSPSDVTKGYLFEIDQRLDGDQWFKTTQGVPIVMKEPELPSAVQFDNIKNQLQTLEDHIANYVDVREEIDLDSWIKWVIVNELMRNSDAVMFSSCFFYKNNNKINMGPVWDFDMSSGAYEGSDAEGWYINLTTWIGGLYLYHPYYKQRFKEIWNEKYNNISSLTQYVKTNGQKLQYSEVENFKRWNMMDKKVYGEQIIWGGYQNEENRLHDFLSQRISWINSQVNGW